MAGWWYSLVGEEDKANAWDGSTLPAGTDYTRASFLNQFVDRLNARVHISMQMGGQASYMARISSGEYVSLAESGFRETWVSKALSLSGENDIYRVALPAVPVDGDLLPLLTYPSREIAYSEFLQLADSTLNAGDDFYDRMYFSSMYSILQKVRIFCGYPGETPHLPFFPTPVSSSGVSTWGARVRYYERPLESWDQVSENWPAVLDSGDSNWGTGWTVGTGILTGGYRRIVDLLDGHPPWYEYDYVEVSDAALVYLSSAEVRVVGNVYVFKYAFDKQEGYTVYDTGYAPAQNAIYKIKTVEVDVEVNGALGVAELPNFGATSCNITEATPQGEDMAGYTVGIYTVIEIWDPNIDYE